MPNFRRYFLAWIASLSLLLTQALPAHAEGETWVGGPPTQQGSLFFEINEVSHASNSFRVLYHTMESKTPQYSYLCPQFNQTPNCTIDEKPGMSHPDSWSVFPTCAMSASENCVDELFVSDSKGEFVKAEYIRNIAGPTFSEDKQLGLIEGSTSALFKAPGAINAGGTDTYVVNVRADQDYSFDSKQFTIGTFRASVLPYRDTPSSNQTVAHTQHTAPDGRVHVGTNTDVKCAWAEDGHCGVPLRYAENQQVKLSFRVTNKLGGWFSGRIKTPDIKVEAFSSSINKITVSGLPVMVPQFQVVVPKTSTNKYVVDYVKNSPYSGGSSFNSESGLVGPERLLVDFREEVKDSVAGFINPFSLSTIRGGTGCFADKSKVLGMVTTDAMLYDGGPPGFAKGQLTYKVAGLHYKPDGVTAIEGSYDLVVRSEVARCLYGFSSAPVQASISVMSDAGESKVATTLVSEKNGWLKLAAYGFTFSSPTISVKLSQAKGVTKTTIACTKGKLVKKVTAVSPKCPAGYKKKS